MTEVSSVVCFVDKNTDKEHLFIVDEDWKKFRGVEIDMNDSLSSLMNDLYDELFINSRQDFNTEKFPQIQQYEVDEYMHQGDYFVLCGRNKRQICD